MNSDLKKFILFICVGASASLADIGMLMLLRKSFNLNLNLAITIAYCTAAIIHFSCNKNIVYKNANIQTSKSIIRYCMLLLTNYIVNLGIINLCITYFLFPLLLSKIIATGICTFISYVMMNYFVFPGNKFNN